MHSEIAQRADFSGIRYAQCWEDADILLEALDIGPDHTCLSVASAGDNVMAMLSFAPARLIAVDFSPAQIACLELRVAAYRALGHTELLKLMGSRPSARREDFYRRCRALLSPDARHFWDARSAIIARGIGGAGRFEGYLALFRNRILPMIHSRQRVVRLLEGGAYAHRQQFYDRVWDTWLWRLLFRLFCSRFVIGRLGRDPSFFRYVEGGVGAHLSRRVRYAATTLDPADNPYLHWILTGRHGGALPYALRPENFETIRANLDRLEWHCASIEEYLTRLGKRSIDRFNLSDIFEYMSPDAYQVLLENLVRRGRPNGRLAYWNFVVPRTRPPCMADRLRSLDTLSRDLHAKDKTFFYNAFVIEEIV